MPLRLLIASLLVCACVVQVGPASAASERLRVTVPTTATAGAPVVVTGSIRRVRLGSTLALQVRVGKRWRTRAHRPAGRASAFTLRTELPAGRWAVRVAVLRHRRVTRASRRHVVVVRENAVGPVLPPVTGASPVLPTAPGANGDPASADATPAPEGGSPTTVVPASSSVESAPAPGESGPLRIAGNADIGVDDVVATGIGARTPYGFLGVVTAVRHEDGSTVLQTQPTTLERAVPQADVDQTAELDAATLPGARTLHDGRLRVPTRTIKCGGGTSVSPTLDLDPSMRFSAAWAPVTGLQSASVSLGGNATAKVAVSGTAGGSCSGTFNVLDRYLKPVTFSVGPVPVVILPRLHVDVVLSVGAGGKLTTAVRSTVTVAGGATYTKAGGLKPTGSVGGSFGADPPEFSAKTTASAHLVSAVDLLFYGAAGPSLQFTTGVDATADPLVDRAKEPWWVLTAPANLGVKFTIPVLGIDVAGTFHIVDRTYTLRRAPLEGDGGGSEDPTQPPRTRLVTDVRWTSLGGGAAMNRPSHITLGPAGDLYLLAGYDESGIANPPVNVVHRSPAGGLTTARGNGLSGFGLAPDGTVWAAEDGEEVRVRHLSGDLDPLREIALLPGVRGRPLSIGGPGFDLDGRPWFAEPYEQRFVRIDRGGAVETIPTGVSTQGAPVFTADGSAWWGGWFTLNRRTANGVVTSIPAPRPIAAVAAAPDGSLWATGGWETIHYFPDTGRMDTFPSGSPGYGHSSDVRVDPEGTAWVADLTEIYWFRADGTTGVIDVMAPPDPSEADDRIYDSEREQLAIDPATQTIWLSIGQDRVARIGYHWEVDPQS